MISPSSAFKGLFLTAILGGLGSLAVYLALSANHEHGSSDDHAQSSAAKKKPEYQPRKGTDPTGYIRGLDTSGYMTAQKLVKPWDDPTSLEQIRDAFANIRLRVSSGFDEKLAGKSLAPLDRLQLLLVKAFLLMYDGMAREAHEVFDQARAVARSDDALQAEWLYTIIFCEGVAGLRCGENENCLKCRGDGACIFPIRSGAVHTNPDGSRLAIEHFTEYLDAFPNDTGVRWLLNLAYMTLGEHPDHVPPKYLMTFDNFGSDYDIGRFKDISQQIGIDCFSQAGGAIMDDFHNDGLFDIVVTSWDASQPMTLFRNKGDGTFEDRTEAAGLSKQLGGSNCVQTDYNNDGFLDVFIVRGGWMQRPMRPTLLRNNGNGTFTDVTLEAGLMDPVNSMSATWADFDNDGFLDLYICCDSGPNRLYHNKGDGTFEEVAEKAGVQGKKMNCKGAAWIDYDNDGYPDLFVTYLNSTPQLFHNERNGKFKDVTEAMGITGPRTGFSCWAFDYDNDGYLDIFATSFDRSLGDIILDMQGKPFTRDRDVTRLYHNIKGQRFEDVSKEAGVAHVFATMGSNFGDFDNDGYLDFYLGTGEPCYGTLVPNRMFKNVDGKRFAEITTTSGTGHLQKGHGVACGDWDRDGNVDLFINLGGATPGDCYHKVMFQNPGQGNNWLEVKLVGTQTNRAAIGARIKAVTAGDNPLTVHRHVSSGSSFGANPLQQHIGLGKASTVANLEIQWPTIDGYKAQTFHNIDANQAIEITEGTDTYRKLNWTPLPVPKK